MPKKPDDDLVPVVEFVTASRDNLEIASAVFEQYEKARQGILRPFFGKLGKRLTSKRPDWWWEYSPPLFDDRFGAFRISKNAWNKRFEIRIEAHDWGKQMTGGVWRNEHLLNGAPRSPEILAAVRKSFPGAKARVWFEAEILIKSPAPDWRTPEVLWRIQTDQEFMREVEVLFLELVRVAELAVDAACGFKKR